MIRNLFRKRPALPRPTYPADLVTDVDDLIAVAVALGVTPPTSERIYAEALRARLAGVR